jgi:TetR/AcrR family fatty acid metabolism transcriptional regulator
MDPRGARTKEEVVKDFRTAEILDAARRVITELGYEGASMERIAQEAGIAKGTTYLYFRNKETLLCAVFEQGFEQLMQRARELVAAAPTHTERVRAMVRAFLEFTGENVPFWQALQNRPDLGPQGDSEASMLIRKQIEQYEQFVAGVIERAIAAGELRRVDPLRCGCYLTDVMRGVVFKRMHAPRPPAPVGGDIDGDVEALVDFFFYGVKGHA